MLTKLFLMPPNKNEDGSTLGAADICGYEASVDNGEAVSLVGGVAQADGRLAFPIAQLALSNGVHTLRVRTATKNGVRSAWTNSVSVTQTVLPNPPTLLSAE